MIKKEPGRKGWSTLPAKKGEVAPIDHKNFQALLFLRGGGPMNRSIGVGNGEDKLGGSMEIDTIDRHLSGIGHRGTSARKDWKEGKK